MVCSSYSPDSQFCAALTIIPLPTPPAPNSGSVRVTKALSAATRALDCGRYSFEDRTAQCPHRSCTSTYHTVQPLHTQSGNCQPSHLHEGGSAAGWVVAD